MITQATAFRLPFRDKSIHVGFTSPPYYGLRVYDDLQPQVWGGAQGCRHEWGEWQESHDTREEITHAKSRTTERFYGDESRRFDGNHQKHTSGAFCRRCGAWLGHLGNEPTPQMYIDHLVTIGREFWRVLRDDGVLLLNLGDSFANVGKWGGSTGGKHVNELHGDTGVGRQKRDYGDFKPKDKLGIPHWAVRELQAAGWYHRLDIPWIKRNGMPESTQDRPSVSHEYFFLLTKSQRYFWDAEAVKQPSVTTREAAANFRRNGSKRENSVVPGQNRGTHRPDRKDTTPSSTRQFRTLDTWTDSLDYLIDQTLAYLASLEASRDEGGLLLDEAGSPLALYGTTQPWSGSHYAVFPPNVVYSLLKGAISEKGCCSACGKPWERVLEKEKVEQVVDYDGKWTKQDKQASQRRLLANMRARREAGHPHNQPVPEAVTIGWKPACSCEAEAGSPAIVCDPFCGSGTVGEVCQGLAAEGYPVQFAGVDLSGTYLATYAAVRAEGRTTDAALAEARQRIEKKFQKAKASLKVIKEEQRGQLSFLNGR